MPPAALVRGRVDRLLDCRRIVGVAVAGALHGNGARIARRGTATKAEGEAARAVAEVERSSAAATSLRFMLSALIDEMVGAIIRIAAPEQPRPRS